MSPYRVRGQGRPFNGRVRHQKFNRTGGKTGSGRAKKAYIHPSKFIKAASPKAEEQYQAVNSFADFDLNNLLKDNIAKKGYVNPSPIQDQAIPLALSGQDVIGIANTGTGKTAAFALPVINKIMGSDDTRALIVAPTRELAEQIFEEMKSLGKGSGLFGALLIGGSAMGPQLGDLRNNPHIVIGTPGRIKDHIERRTLNLQNFNIVVLDEVDRMLDMGFVNDVRQILECAAQDRQSLFFSATLDQRVKGIIHDFAPDAQTVAVKTGVTSDNVHQNVVYYNATEDKIEKLHEELIKDEVSKVVIFDETKFSVERLSKKLADRGFKADAIHGGKTQGQRRKALQMFKESKINVLVATDVAARGIDVSDITHVINYSTPQTYDDYVHRIGRAGRANRVGYALTFLQK